MKVTSEMYTKLFNELTDIQVELQILIDRMKIAQIETEKMYIEGTKEEEKTIDI